AGRALPELRRGLVVVVLGVRGDARLVVVELRVLDDQVAAGVGAGVAERAELGVRVDKGRVAVGAGAEVVGGVADVAGVAVPEQAVAAEASVPSTMTALRSMPRRWRLGVRIMTPDGRWPLFTAFSW